MDFSSNLSSNILALISIIVSAALVFFYLRDRRHNKLLLKREYEQELLSWYSETIEIVHLLKFKAKKGIYDSSSNELLAKLSALIERGRFFFPNIDMNDGFGEEKPTAYRGYRNLALDFLVALYNIFSDTKNCDINIRHAEQLSRYFTSIIFEVINPKDNLKLIKAITDKYYVKEQIFEDFLNKKDPSILNFIWKRDI